MGLGSHDCTLSCCVDDKCMLQRHGQSKASKKKERAASKTRSCRSLLACNTQYGWPGILLYWGLCPGGACFVGVFVFEQLIDCLCWVLQGDVDVGLRPSLQGDNTSRRGLHAEQFGCH